MKPNTGKTGILAAGSSPAVPSALVKLCVITLVAAAGMPGLAGADTAGTVDFAAGNVMLVYDNGDRETLSKGMSVSAGDTIRTGYRGLAQIRMTDGGYISVQKNSSFRIDEYAYDPAQGGQKKNRGLFSLLEGGFRAITGFLGADNYSVKTPVATIGIRGTEYSAELGRSLTVFVAAGAVQICNEAGCQFFRTDEAGYVEDAGALIQRLRDMGLDIVVSTERGETTASLEEDETFRFKINEEVDENGESILLGDEDDGASGSFTPPDCSSFNCAAAFGYVQSGSYLVQGTTQTFAEFNGDVMTRHSGGQEWVEDYFGTTNPESAGVNANLAWGRWTGGSTTFNLDAVHYVIGLPTPQINNLSGSYSFRVAGFTNPTVRIPSAVGSFQGVNGSLQADFTNSLVDLDFQVEFANANYAVTTPSQLVINSDATFGGFPQVQGGPANSCLSGPCNGAVKGFFSGKEGESAGLSYHIDDPVGADDITGVVVFGKD